MIFTAAYRLHWPGDACARYEIRIRMLKSQVLMGLSHANCMEPVPNPANQCYCLCTYWTLFSRYSRYSMMPCSSLQAMSTPSTPNEINPSDPITTYLRRHGRISILQKASSPPHQSAISLSPAHLPWSHSCGIHSSRIPFRYSSLPYSATDIRR
jgi:hypothetical protein